MKYFLTYCFTLVALFVGTLVTAQESTCQRLTTNLSRPMRHPEVAVLQQFLIQHGHLALPTATIYYGVRTEIAVKDFQCKQGIACDGSPFTNGYGAVGPRTRTVINSMLCGQSTSSRSASRPPDATTTNPVFPIISTTPPTPSTVSEINLPPIARPPANPLPSIPMPPPVSGGGCRVDAKLCALLSGDEAKTCYGWGSVRATGFVTEIKLQEAPSSPGNFVGILDKKYWRCEGSGEWVAHTTAGAACATPWGTTVPHGARIQAYHSATAVLPVSCTPQTRTCTDGVLSGSFRYESCRM